MKSFIIIFILLLIIGMFSIGCYLSYISPSGNAWPLLVAISLVFGLMWCGFIYEKWHEL